MVINASGQDTAKSALWVQSFSLFHEDACDKDDLILRIKGALANSGHHCLVKIMASL